MPSLNRLLAATAALACAHGVYAKFDLESSKNVVVYWGQNSFNGQGEQAQQRLGHYCENEDIDAIVLAFVMNVNGQGGYPEYDLSTASEDCEPFEGTNLKNCPEIGKDIKSCQEKGKAIILSIGGATYSEGGFESESDAKAGAELIWKTFGPSSSSGGGGGSSSSSSKPSGSGSPSSSSSPGSSSSPNSKPEESHPSKSTPVAHAQPTHAKPTHAKPTNLFSGNHLFNYPFHPTRFHASHLARSDNAAADDTKTLRPFGDASVDGFDFDFEAATKNMAPFANRLRELADEDNSKRIYLTAAPQCPYPDAADKDILNGPVSIDAVFVQFYNNACGLQAFESSSDEQTNFNFKTWDEWARETSQNKNAKVLVGAPGNQAGASSGYVDGDQLAQVLKYAEKFESSGGVMFWDVTQVYSNQGFLDTVVQALGEGQSRAQRWMG